ncbi:MFS transporter [Patescibacteria group bacterium]|nr:MFS transporter [Patescibacteria group bacterium]
MTDIAYKQGLRRNITLYYFQKFFLGLIFFLPVWVAFELRFTNFAGLALLEVIQALVGTVAELPTGAFADIFGRKKSIALGMLSSATLFFFFGFLPSFPWLVVFFFIWGVTTTFISGADSALLYDSLKDLSLEDTYAKVTSKGSLIYRIAIAIGTLTGGFLYKIWIPLPYVLYGVVYFVAGLLATQLTEPKIDSEKFSFRSYLRQTKTGVHEAFKNAHITFLSIYYVVIGGFSWAATYFFSNVYAQQNGFGPDKQGILFFFVYLIKSLFAVIIAHLEYFFNRKNIYIAMFIFSILSFLPAFYIHGFWIVSIILATEFTSSLRFTLLDKYVNQEFDSRSRATALSFLSLLLNIVYVSTVFFTRNLSDSVGVGAIYSILGAIILIFISPITYLLVKNHHS